MHQGSASSWWREEACTSLTPQHNLPAIVTQPPVRQAGLSPSHLAPTTAIPRCLEHGGAWLGACQEAPWGSMHFARAGELGELCGAMLYSNCETCFWEVWCVVRAMRVHAVDGWVCAGQLRVLLADKALVVPSCCLCCTATCYMLYVGWGGEIIEQDAPAGCVSKVSSSRTRLAAMVPPAQAGPGLVHGMRRLLRHSRTLCLRAGL